MKVLLTALSLTLLLSACSAEVGSEEWCQEMKEKDKGDWTATETKDFTKHCIF
jgi:protein involved in sex pheromone biosynthesis